jgi:hypothetical protein
MTADKTENIEVVFYCLKIKALTRINVELKEIWVNAVPDVDASVRSGQSHCPSKTFVARSVDVDGRRTADDFHVYFMDEVYEPLVKY